MIFLVALARIHNPVQATNADVPSAELNTARYRVYLTARQMEWQERLEGEKLLEESGPIWGFGAEASVPVKDDMDFGFGAEFFFGEITYDGLLVSPDGSKRSYKSETEYIGIKLACDLGVDVALADKYRLTPYLGPGVQAWRRHLDTRLLNLYFGRYGYREDWLTMYALFGLQLTREVEEGEIYAKAEGRLTVMNRLKVDLTNVGGPDDISLEPGRKTSTYFELGYNASPISLALFYENMRFSESPIDERYERFFQPESHFYTYGIKAGIIF